MPHQLPQSLDAARHSEKHHCLDAQGAKGRWEQAERTLGHSALRRQAANGISAARDHLGGSSQ
eukprot:612260-Alexandrium_andersonii.AAC.1